MSNEETRNARISDSELFEDTRSAYRDGYSDSWALVVGINEYEHLKPLKHAVYDAQAIAKLLIEEYDFKEDRVHVKLDKNAHKDAIEEVLEKFIDQTQPDDRILIYFAGHGLTRQYFDGREEGFLAPVSGERTTGELSKFKTCISTSFLANQLSKAAAKHVFCVLDCCFSGLIFEARGVEPATRLQSQMLKRRARLALTAGQDDQLVNDGGIGEHSIFTHFLLEGLKGKAGSEAESNVGAYELMAYVQKMVSNYPQAIQTPTFGPIEGHENGDFIFMSTMARLPVEIVEALNNRIKLAVRVQALKDLGERLEPRTDKMLLLQMEALSVALMNGNERERLQAASSFKQLADPLAFDYLIPALDEGQERDAEVRKTVVFALGATSREDACPHLVKSLENDSNVSVQEAAIFVLGELKNPVAIGALCEALKPEKPLTVRIEAVKALLKRADPNSFDTLVKALEDKEAEVRLSAAQAIGKLKNERAVHALSRALLGDPDWRVRAGAAQALGRLSDARGIAALMMEIEHDENATVRLHAVKNLGDFQQVDFIDFLGKALKDQDAGVRRETVYVLGGLKQPRAVIFLGQALDDSDAEVRQAAAIALGENRHPDAAGYLVTALNDADVNVRRYAAHSLAALMIPEAAPELAKKFQDEDAKVRLIVANALGPLGNREVLPDLVAALNDSDPETKRGAAISLGLLGDERSFDGIMEALKNGDASVRNNAVNALGQLVIPKAASSLRGIVESDGTEELRVAAVDALGDLKTPAEPETKLLLLKTFHDDRSVEVRAAAACSLGALKDKEYFQPLLDMLNAKDAPDLVREGAAVGLGLLGAEEAVAPLITSLDDPSEVTRLGAIWALGNFKAKEVVEPLAKALLDDKNGTDLRSIAAQRLGQVGFPEAASKLVAALEVVEDEEALLAVIKALIVFDEILAALKGDAGLESRAILQLANLLENHESAEVRREAASALGQVGDERAVEPLLKALQDSDTNVAAWAIVSLGRLDAQQALGDLKYLYFSKNNLQLWVAWAAGRLRDDDALNLFMV